MNLEQDPRWLAARDARWFAGKGRSGRPVSIEPLDWFSPPAAGAPGVRAEVLTVVYPDGDRESYQLLTSYRAEPLDQALLGPAPDGPGWVHEATRDPAALALLLTALLDRGAGGTDWSATLLDATPLHQAEPIRLFGGEQSNTNVLLGQAAILKIFRRLEAGRNLDIEMLEALNRAGVSQVATLYGWVSARLPAAAAAGGGVPGGGSADLMMITRLLPQATDGWQLALASCAADTDFTPEARALGAALASIHAALADAWGTGSTGGDDLARTMRRRLDAALEVVAELQVHADSLRRLFSSLESMHPSVQRVHGDFHLGQSLRTAEGWAVIDFEGEPITPRAERERPDSPWRDVAGLVRSLSYAAGASAGTRDDPGAEQHRQVWRRSATQAFLAGYLDRPMTDQERTLLAAYVADKAIYETVYEKRNRPEWLAIPLADIAVICSEED